jgi:hypothetical protein
VEFYDLETLRPRTVAFNGTVTAVRAQRVTFSAEERLEGDVDQTVTVAVSTLDSALCTLAPHAKCMNNWYGRCQGIKTDLAERTGSMRRRVPLIELSHRMR